MTSVKEKLLLKLNPKTLIRRSEYFDEKWYSEKYGIKEDATGHYLNVGWRKDFDPSVRFSSKEYLINNPDIHDMNPLLHYEVYGKKEGRRPFAVKNPIINSYETGKSDLPYEAYEKTITEKKAVSFDVFDTLVIRPVLDPEDVFACLSLRSDDAGFVQERKKAEEKARKALNKEVDIDEIYEFIDKKYKEMKEEEIEIELLFCHVNPQIKRVYDFAKRENKRVIAVSDMYLPEKVIRKILENSGYQMDAVYVSCDIGKTKGSGKLFEYVLEHEDISAADMVHFGDNYISDYSEALRKGIAAFQTPKINDVMFDDIQSRYTLSYYRRHEELSSSILLSQLSEHFASNKEEPFFERLGYSLGGPLAYAYLTFVCARAKELGIDRLLFVARDGYCLEKVYKEYLYEKVKIESAYAYLSRAAIYSGALENGLCKDPSKILSIARHYIPSIRISEDEKENEQEFDRHIQELKKWSSKRSADLKRHLETICQDGHNIAVIDMFSGAYTSLKGAMYYLAEKKLCGFFAGNFAQSELRHESFAKRLLGMSDNMSVKMSEFLITSYESAIIGVDEDLEPVYENKEDEKRKERFDQILDGIRNYIEDHKRFFLQEAKYLPSLEEWLDLSDSFLRECSDEDLKEFKKVIDSQDPVSCEKDRNFYDLIRQYRNKGY